jgi:chromosome segregation ATPase
MTALYRQAIARLQRRRWVRDNMPDPLSDALYRDSCDWQRRATAQRKRADRLESEVSALAAKLDRSEREIAADDSRILMQRETIERLTDDKARHQADAGALRQENAELHDAVERLKAVHGD